MIGNPHYSNDAKPAKLRRRSGANRAHYDNDDGACFVSSFAQPAELDVVFPSTTTYHPQLVQEFRSVGRLRTSVIAPRSLLFAGTELLILAEFKVEGGTSDCCSAGI